MPTCHEERALRVLLNEQIIELARYSRTHDRTRRFAISAVLATIGEAGSSRVFGLGVEPAFAALVGYGILRRTGADGPERFEATLPEIQSTLANSIVGNDGLLAERPQNAA